MMPPPARARARRDRRIVRELDEQRWMVRSRFASDAGCSLVALSGQWQPTERIAAMTPTIILVHGLWMTPRSWEHWIERYTSRGYRVRAPAHPGLEGEVEALREDPAPIAAVTVPDTVAHLEGIVRGLDG